MSARIDPMRPSAVVHYDRLPILATAQGAHDTLFTLVGSTDAKDETIDTTAKS